MKENIMICSRPDIYRIFIIFFTDKRIILMYTTSGIFNGIGVKQLQNNQITPKVKAILLNANNRKANLVFKNKLKSGFYYANTFWILLKLALEYPGKLP